MTPRLTFRDVTGSRGGRTLFSGISFDLAPGGAVRVTGANGAGKSSLMRLAAGLLAPVAGTIERAGKGALLAETCALDGDVPLRRALAFWAKLDHRPAADVDEAMAALSLAALGDVPVRLLSTGQRRRAGLARVICSGAPQWLLDEPLSGVDVETVQRIEERLARHRAAGGIVAVATHQAIDLPGAVEVSL